MEKTLIKSLLLVIVLLSLVYAQNLNAKSFEIAKGNQTIRGQVTDAPSGEPIPGVNISIKGTSTGTVSDVDGFYELRLETGDGTLIFSFIGYETYEIDLEGRLQLDVALQPAVGELGEVVVVGYGTVDRRELTGSISSVNRRDIVNTPVYSIENVLQGRATGVDIVANSFRPGAGATIRIRGERSLVAGNDPLVVLDGMPIEGGLMDLNPSDIESVEILKDASATAIYGSRGSNGVILVTTRRGAAGATQIEYSGSAGLQRIANRVDLMNAERYIELQRDAARQQGSYTTDENLFLDWELEAIRNGVDTDWQREAFGAGFQQNHQISVRGGTQDTRYAFSGTITEHQAIVENNDFTRFVGRLNLDQEVTSNFRAGVSAQVTTSTEHRAGNFRDLILRSPLDWPDRGQEALRSEFAVGESFPLLNLNRELFIDRRDRTRVLSNIYAELNLFDWLSYRLNFAPDFTFFERGTHNWQNSSAGVSNNTTRNLLFENIIDFDRQLGQIHRLRGTALYSVQTNRVTGTSVNVRGLPFEQQRYHNIGTAEETQSRNTNLQEWTLESYMLRLNYSLLERYLVTVTGRVDGSSRLAEGNKYGLFPSVAFAWLLSDEAFMQQQTIFSDLKLRLSYGDVGNTGIQPYQTQGRVSRVGYSFGDQSVFGFQSAELANSNLRWERTRQIDLGVDFGVLNQRVTGTVGLYQQNTIDLLMNRQLPPTSGFASTLENVGSTRNRGLEIGLSTVLIQTERPGGFRWTTDVNFHTNRNEIVELYGGREDDPGNGWFIGQPINVLYDWEFVGIWQESERELAAQYGHQPGDMRLRDVTGDGRIGADDRVILGSEAPEWTGSLTSRMNYRNVDFSFQVYATQGVTIFSQAGGTSLGGMINLRRGYNLNSRNIHYWTPDNPSSDFPQPRVRGHDYSTPMAYFDASYVRIRNITLGYNFSPRMLDVVGFSRARIYSTVQNPFTFTSFPGLDPEGARNHDMPNYRTFMMGIELSL